jgi:hypothetical protein
MDSTAKTQRTQSGKEIAWYSYTAIPVDDEMGALGSIGAIIIGIIILIIIIAIVVFLIKILAPIIVGLIILAIIIGGGYWIYGKIKGRS